MRGDFHPSSPRTGLGAVYAPEFPPEFRAARRAAVFLAPFALLLLALSSSLTV